MLFKKKVEPRYIFKRTQFLPFIFGIIFIFLFFLIYIIIAIETEQLNFYSFFFHNIKTNLFLIILSGFHVGLLGIGILIIMISVFNMTLEVKCYKDKFSIGQFLQKKIEIEFSKINKISVKVIYLNYENLFKKYINKECRVFIDNSIHPFYLCFKIRGYFDDIEIKLSKNKEDFSTRCVADRESVVKLLTELKLFYDINYPFLPEEYN